ncbi:hypothetical protein JNW89_31670, partial [Micromonospora sp. 4G55]|nr:hypothetical protein [Micromonospora sp. 4G55]
MRIFERLTSVAVALAFVLAGLGAPACPGGHSADHAPAGHHALAGHALATGEPDGVPPAGR